MSSLLFSNFLGPVGIVGTVIWLWMIYDCLNNEPDRQTWLWILIFLNVIGGALYFFTRWWPRAYIPTPGFAKRWTMKDKLWQAEADARNIGKAHQYVKLGDVLTEMRERERAAKAYRTAVEQESDNLLAHWGLAQLALRRQDLADARASLAAIMEKQPNFQYGEAASLYGDVLFQLNDLEAAEAHFQEHYRDNSKPETALTLAKLYQQQGKTDEAREVLESMTVKVKGSPPYYYKKHKATIRSGKKLLRSLGTDLPI